MIGPGWPSLSLAGRPGPLLCDMKGAPVNDSPIYEQPRIPGVKYKPEPRFRQETTVIDGKASTRDVRYMVMVPQPPRDWYRLIIRGVTGLAIGITSLAAVGTTASVGGQLTEILHPVISYGVGLVFTATWLACLGLEWALSQTDPQRAVPPRIAGWVALLISMGAVFSYGYDHGQQVAGGVGACLDLLAKGLWALLIYAQSTPLSEGIAHWVRDQQQEAAGQARLARQISRLNSERAYQQAVGGTAFQAAGAIITQAEPAPALPAPAPVAPAAAPVPAAPPVPPVTPAPQPPVQPVPVPAAVPVPAPAAVPPVTPPPAPPAVSLVGGSIAATVRQALVDHPEWEEKANVADLIKHVEGIHGADPKLIGTVPRTRDRDIAKRQSGQPVAKQKKVP